MLRLLLSDELGGFAFSSMLLKSLISISFSKNSANFSDSNGEPCGYFFKDGLRFTFSSSSKFVTLAGTELNGSRISIMFELLSDCYWF